MLQTRGRATPKRDRRLAQPSPGEGQFLVHVPVAHLSGPGGFARSNLVFYVDSPGLHRLQQLPRFAYELAYTVREHSMTS
jgi:hypothetical protein